uniref:Protein C' n=4 Tax=Sendai virus (strain Nagoya) TaxID=317654 RepID=C_SENDN|nr:RecName: Full=Protein C' [Sendai virus (strain Nagoya)]
MASATLTAWIKMPSFLKKILKLRGRRQEDESRSRMLSDSSMLSCRVNQLTSEGTEAGSTTPSTLPKDQALLIEPKVRAKEKSQHRRPKIIDQVRRVESLGEQASQRQKHMLETLINKIYTGPLGEELVQTLYLRIWTMEETPESLKILQMREDIRDQVLKMKTERWLRTLIRGEKTKLKDFQKRYEEVHPYLMKEKVEQVIMEEAWSLAAHIVQE